MIETEGLGPLHHGLDPMANRVLGWCRAGYTVERIAALARSNPPALHASQAKKVAQQPATDGDSR